MRAVCFAGLFLAGFAGAQTVDSGALVRTDNGRTEVRLAGGAMVALAENSAVRVIGNRLTILTGSVVVITGAADAVVDCEDSVQLAGSGVYRFDKLASPRSTSDTPCRFRVYAGTAKVELATLTAAMKSGQQMNMERACGDMIPTFPFDPAPLDELDRWSRARAAAVPEQEQ